MCFTRVRLSVSRKMPQFPKYVSDICQPAMEIVYLFCSRFEYAARPLSRFTLACNLKCVTLLIKVFDSRDVCCVVVGLQISPLAQLREGGIYIRLLGGFRKIKCSNGVEHVMMPPPGMPRPDKATLDGFSSFLETSIDQAAATNPRPGRATVHRLNRTEYANAVRDLLAHDVDATALLPPDDESSGFDNIADVLNVPPSLMERYLSASWNISRAATGNPGISPSTAVYRVRPDLSQDQHLDGMNTHIFEIA